jgi:hypothetical protein
MSTQRSRGRLFGVSALGLASLAACAGAASPARSLREGDEDAVEQARRIEAEKDKSDAGAPGDAGGAPRCPYGELSDPHRGFVRCLTPDERDAGWLPPPSQEPVPAPAPEVPDAGKATPAPVTPPPAPPPLVELGAPKFDNGEVPKVEKFLNGLLTDVAKCVSDHGGLASAAGSIKVQFLVRARGRAEGVEVLSSKGIGAEAASCVRLLLKNRAVGTPSVDPVGVTVTLTLKAPPK